MNIQVVYPDGTAYDYNDVNSVSWPSDNDPGQKVMMNLVDGSYVVINWAHVSEIRVEEN